METKDIIFLAVTLLILGEVTYLLARLPKTAIKAKDRAILVDTSVLMDGRITGIAATGFIGGTLVVPRSVIGELQFLADHADAEKRSRARAGLDIVNELQKMETVAVEILQDGSKAVEGVDERLLSLAKAHAAVICTLDYNLNKVAVVEGITVLNINELAQSLRMAYLPGERMMIELTGKGSDSHQAVGHLPDGTMVVVEHARSHIGQSVLIEVVRSLQTAAGKMMFAKLAEPDTVKSSEKKPRSSGRAPITRREKAVVKKADHQESEPTRAAEPEPIAKSSRTVYHASPRTQKRSQEQKPAQKSQQQSAEKEQPHAQKQHKSASNEQANAPKRQIRPQRNSRRRNDHEADLIALVNNQ